MNISDTDLLEKLKSNHPLGRLEEKIAIFSYLYFIFKRNHLREMKRVSKLSLILYKLFNIFPKDYKHSNITICKLIYDYRKSNKYDWYIDREITDILKLQFYPLWKDKITIKQDITKQVFEQFHFRNDYERMQICENILKDLIEIKINSINETAKL